MRTVHKFTIHRTRVIGETDICCLVSVSKDAKIVLVGSQPSGLQIWIEVDTETLPVKPRQFKIFGTGEPVTGTHVGSFMEGKYIWHVYEQEVT